MKIFMVLCICTSFLYTSEYFGQVPNGGFENWTGTEPDFWTTNNADPYFTVTQSNGSHSGSFALRGECIAFIPPILPVIGPVGYCGGDDNYGFQIEMRFNSLHGYYKLNSQGGDRLYISLIVSADTNVIGGGGIVLSDAASYTAFAVPITYIAEGTPNRCYLSFQLANPDSGYLTFGSEMYLDDLELSMDVVSVDNEVLGPQSFGLSQNYPNPFNPSTKIRYQVSSVSNVVLKVYDILGSEVVALVNEEKPAGSYEIDFNASELTSGVYFYKLQAGSFTETKKMILMK